jgi:hypothetical protein
VPGSAGRQFVLVSVGELPPWISEATRDVSQISRLTVGAIAPEAGIVLGLAEAGGWGGRGSFGPRSSDRPSL